jgi:hypothetical protein
VFDEKKKKASDRSVEKESFQPIRRKKEGCLQKTLSKSLDERKTETGHVQFLAI